ncbi:uncharacterized protein F5Z01DRAFT_691559 [Emericellopsis atlantica]|uniref:Uncharacterized protein n=1 Tax=Emericellopsis atlantica TaxID=2614577 RepID=A0A9P7ZHK0_9HYPO|nr:uncharacterized protein F5Z01DRAFT_691559 [Emericellopsis atlantica]KAG9251977.1 hypothetical protein F5Z01DRAFT_691559 [Emericellopsis atlantica]
MKVATTLASALLFGITNAGTIGRRWIMDVDTLEEDCNNAPGRDPYARSVMITLMDGPNIAESLQGKFSIKDGQRLAHTFDPACKHISTVEIEPKGGGNGFSAEIDIGVETVEVTVDCMGFNFCGGIIDPEISGVDRPANVKCVEDSPVRYPGVVNVYAYKTCQIHYQ